jgi:hypothetical protein
MSNEMFSRDVKKDNPQLNYLYSLNPSCPKSLIDDVYNMMKDITPEEDDELNTALQTEENWIKYCEKHNIKYEKIKRLDKNEIDAVECLSFNSKEEQDLWFLKNGKITQEEFDAERQRQLEELKELEELNPLNVEDD